MTFDADRSYDLVFSREDGQDDTVAVHATSAIGPNGRPVYRDDTGIIQAEIGGDDAVVMLPTSAHQRPRRPAGLRARVR
ncbi:DUF6296 family protein [Streptacidiphilus jiangxiensis]|uniref:Uncharacterized protein n=1 Tax=Streptacidiphilus jiangxiensis TaxID=235985 RepID=A0A1H7YVD8_STRJI|nr:DUF6296 family protein [Streptacidiphilus jiangxiensis]SEM50070.1 hypothetical protein SAMN05414137_1316 [Streptacidiphilus jiangxiensis]